MNSNWSGAINYTSRRESKNIYENSESDSNTIWTNIDGDQQISNYSGDEIIIDGSRVAIGARDNVGTLRHK